MKVCTDACFFGAWVAARMKGQTNAGSGILDIGTGTGLLSLMLAQELEGNIEGIEIDPSAAAQTLENIKASPFTERLQVIQQDLLHFKPAHQYDLIISNPPFYENDLRSPDPAVNHARHEAGLTLELLLKFMQGHLKTGGTAALLLPASRAEECESLIQSSSLNIREKLSLKHSNVHPIFRVMYLLNNVETKTSSFEISIHEEGNTYSESFIKLLKPFYIKL